MIKRFFSDLYQSLKLERTHKKIKSIHDEDLFRILDESGQTELIKSGIYQCPVCEKKIILEKIGGWHIVDGQIKYICDDDLCLINVGTGRLGDN